MGVTAVVSSSTSSVSELSLFLELGVGIGGIFVTAMLAYLLAYLNIVEASERDRQHLRSLLITSSLPLTFAFAGIITFESLSVLGFI